MFVLLRIFIALITRCLILGLAPSTTVRQTPAGIMLNDGFSTKIAFQSDPDVSFWEKTVQPPGIDGGDAIEITTMHNTTWRTMVPRALKTLTEITGTAAYDPNVVNNVNSLINVNNDITVHFPDGSTLDFYGYLKSVEFGENTEGEQPELTYTIVPTNYDNVNRVEAGPVLTSVAGT